MFKVSEVSSILYHSTTMEPVQQLSVLSLSLSFSLSLSDLVPIVLFSTTVQLFLIRRLVLLTPDGTSSGCLLSLYKS